MLEIKTDSMAFVISNLNTDPENTAAILAAMYVNDPKEFRKNWIPIKEINEAELLARTLHNMYVKKGVEQLQKYNGYDNPLGRLLGVPTIQFVKSLPSLCMGLCYADKMMVDINLYRLMDVNDQCDNIFQTIPHEVAHLLQGALLFNHGDAGLTEEGVKLFDQSFSKQWHYTYRRNGETVHIGRFLAHGKIWKKIFKDITGFHMIKGRFFRQVTVASYEKK
jgi:predicted SprT family Zn-dependent metalloprotease